MVSNPLNVLTTFYSLIILIPIIYIESSLFAVKSKCRDEKAMVNLCEFRTNGGFTMACMMILFEVKGHYCLIGDLYSNNDMYLKANIPLGKSFSPNALKM